MPSKLQEALCVAGALLVSIPCRAEALPQDAAERDCWQRYTAERTQVSLSNGTRAVNFGNLRNGDTIVAPFRVDFTTRGIGIAPAGKAVPKTGHHHLLVDTPLPLIPTDKIPFSARHIHFGKGQISAVLDLEPGTHTLQLLFADHDHRPYYVFSPQIKVNVRRADDGGAPRVDPADFDRTCSAWYRYVETRPRPAGERVYFANVRDGESVRSPLRLGFGVDGVPIGARTAAVAGTGHFALEVKSENRASYPVDLGSGATQTDLDLAPGRHLLRLRFLDSTTGKDRLQPQEITLHVAS